MAKILYTATTADGDPTEGFVDAAGAREARDRLLAQGLRDVVLQQEAMLAQDPAELAGLSEPQVQALARLNLRMRSDPALSTALLETARRSMWWLVADAVLVGLAYSRGMTGTVLFGLAVALAPFAMTAWGWRRVGRYQQLLRAFAVGDGAAVQALADKLRAAGSVPPALDFDLDVRLATLQAHGGPLQPALQRIEPWQARLAAQPGLYETRLASVHLAGGDPAAFVRLMGEAREASGNDPARALDHALALARLGDPAEAARLLQGIDQSLLPPMAAGFLTWLRGLLQSHASEPEAARTLGEAVEAFLKMSDQPAVWTALAACSADHALALQAAGQAESARRQVAHVWPVLQAHADAALLQRLQAAGLQPSIPSASPAS